MFTSLMDKIIDGLKYSIAAFIFKRDKVLIIKRKENDYATGWEMVKGGIKVGETEEQACLREIKEETGLTDVEIIKKLDYWHDVIPGLNLKVKSRPFVLKYKSGEIKLSPEHEDYKWVTIEEAKKIIWVPGAKEELDEIKKILIEQYNN